MRRLHAFTLVELIIVITILAILVTIGFIQYNGYVMDARNSARLNDIGEISKAAQSYIASKNIVPTLSGGTSVTASGKTIRIQGDANSDFLSKIHISNTSDPLDLQSYAISESTIASKISVFAFLENSNGQRTSISSGDELGLWTASGSSMAHDSSGIEILTESLKVFVAGNSVKYTNSSGSALLSEMTLKNSDGKNLSAYDSSLMLYYDMETLRAGKVADY